MTGGDGLSRYTANLMAYLECQGIPGSADLLAASVRLAVDLHRSDGLVAVSHHDRPLDRMGDGARLTYRAHSGFEDFRAALARELRRHRCALVVGYSTQLPWSIQRDGPVVPHFLLVDGRAGKRWHVEDRFTGLMPSGREQAPFTGWVSEPDLAGLTRPRGPEQAKHRLRNSLAFGFETFAPAGQLYLMLHRQPRTLPSSALAPPWVTGTAEALAALGEHLADGSVLVADPDVVDDCWAAAQHHLFRYRRLSRHLNRRTTSARRRTAVKEAARCWGSLPRTLRFATASARRGRPRAALVRTTFTELAEREHVAGPALTGAVLVATGAVD